MPRYRYCPARQCRRQHNPIFFGSPEGSSLHLELGNRHNAMDNREHKIFALLEKILAPLMQNMSNFDSLVHTLSQSVGTLTTMFTSVEQNVSSLAARVPALEAVSVSTSSVSGSPAGSWPFPGQLDGSTTTGSRDPSASDDDRNTRRRLDRDSDSDDEHTRIAVFPRFFLQTMTRCHKKLLLQQISQKGTIVQEEPSRLGSFLLPEPSVKILWQDSKMASSTRLTALSALPRVQSSYGNPNHKHSVRLVGGLHSFGKLWERSYKAFSLIVTTKALFSFWPLTFACPDPFFFLLLMYPCLKCPRTFWNKSFMTRSPKPKGPCAKCDGRPLAFSPLGGSRRFPFLWLPSTLVFAGSHLPLQA